MSFVLLDTDVVQPGGAVPPPVDVRVEGGVVDGGQAPPVARHAAVDRAGGVRPDPQQAGVEAARPVVHAWNEITHTLSSCPE